MIEKDTYNTEELAKALNTSNWKVMEMIRKDEIKHIHLNQTHHNVRIPRDEYERLVKGTAA